jgi:hypothetical protein
MLPFNLMLHAKLDYTWSATKKQPAATRPAAAAASSLAGQATGPRTGLRGRGAPSRPSLDSHASSTPDVLLMSPSIAELQRKYGNDSAGASDVLQRNAPSVPSSGVHTA